MLTLGRGRWAVTQRPQFQFIQEVCEGWGGGGSKTPVLSSSTRGQNTQTDDPLCQTLHQLYAENFPWNWQKGSVQKRQLFSMIFLLLWISTHGYFSRGRPVCRMFGTNTLMVLPSRLCHWKNIYIFLKIICCCCLDLFLASWQWLPRDDRSLWYVSCRSCGTAEDSRASPECTASSCQW